MKAQVEVVQGLQRKLNVNVPQEVVASAFSKVFSDIQKQVEIKGFRKGKAPLATVKSMYKDRVVGDVAQDLIQAHYPLALKEQSVSPISYPEFEFEDPKENQEFSFSALFDIRPEIKIKKIDGLEVEKEKFVFNEEQMEKTLNNIRASKAQLVDVLELRGAVNGDLAIIDFEGFVDGKPLENGAGQGHQLELGAKQFIEGFEEGVVGMKVGEEKTLKLKFPEVYHAAEIAGKPVDFKVKLTGLKKKDLPELNDELLAQIGTKQTVEEFKQSLKSDIEKSETKRIEDAFKNRLLKRLVAANPVEVPNSLLKDQKASLIEDFKKRMSEQGMQEADLADYISKWDGDFAKTASEMIQSSFLVDTIASEYKLDCNETDLENKFDEYAKQTGIELARIKEWYSKPEQMNRLSYMITKDKVIKFLTEKAKVKEVDAKDLKDEKN